MFVRTIPKIVIVYVCNMFLDVPLNKNVEYVLNLKSVGPICVYHVIKKVLNFKLQGWLKRILGMS